MSATAETTRETGGADDGRQLWGIAAEFTTPDDVLRAARAARRAGYRAMSAYSPYHVEGLAEAVGFRFNWLPVLILLAGFGGAGAGYFMQWYANVYSYPLTVAGRPHHSWPSFIPITFEMGVLGAALTGIVGLCALSGLPRLYHPIFSAPGIGRLSAEGRFFLCIEARDARFEPSETRRFLQGLEPQEVQDVRD